jgi:HIRAN domain-containing protein
MHDDPRTSTMVLIQGPWPDPSKGGDGSNTAAGYNPAEPPLRWQSDPDHVRRFEHRPPRGFSMKLAENVEVAGISRPDSSATAEAFMRGTGHDLRLERDPDNAFDPNAIKVMALWRDHAGAPVREAQIGWLPADLARQIAEVAADRPLAAVLRVMFLPRPDASPGLRFDIWQPRGGKRIWSWKRAF